MSGNMLQMPPMPTPQQLQQMQTHDVLRSLQVPGPDAAQRAPSEKAAQKYCVVDTVTGSHLSHKICKTRQDWISQDGFDPLAKR